MEEPSQELYCPVTYYLMIQPHRTSCCKKNISKEAATRIKEDGKACPFCRAPAFDTKLNKEMRKNVQSLQVFCPHEDRGCQWKGKLRHFESHVKSCPKKDAPQVAGKLGSTG